VLLTCLPAHKHQGQCFSPVSATGKQRQVSPEDSTLGDFAGLTPVDVSSADPEVVASELGGRFGLA